MTKRDDLYMKTAIEVASYSKCPRKGVGMLQK